MGDKNVGQTSIIRKKMRRVEKQKDEKEGEKYLPERRKREGMRVCLSLWRAW